jgi:hypothetical protein
VAEQKVQLPPRSAYIKTPVYKLGDGTVVFGLQRPGVFQAPTDRLVTVSAAVENRLDVLSYQLYGTPDYWWAIAQDSLLVDPLMEVPEGTQLRIPLKSRLPST